MSDKATLPLRSEVTIEETWNLESIFPTHEEWQAALDAPALKEQ